MVMKSFTQDEIAQRHEDFITEIAKTMEWVIKKVEKLEAEVKELKNGKGN